MPELPEVETVARQLKPVIVNQKIKGVKVLDSKLKAKWNSRVNGQLVQDVVRLGKQVVLVLTNDSKIQNLLTIHLRMTGRLIWVANQDHKTITTYDHVRVVFSLEEGQILFVDTRRFGQIVYHPGPINEDKINKGCDPTSKIFTPEYLLKLLFKAKQEIKTWLLRQDRLVGLGNIYACEILYQARIHPKRLANTLTPKEATQLHRAITKVLTKAIKNCGTTFSDFQTTTGETGSYQRFLNVYQKQSHPCKNCQTPISRIIQQQRSTFFCPSCQQNL